MKEARDDHWTKSLSKIWGDFFHARKTPLEGLKALEKTMVGLRIQNCVEQKRVCSALFVIGRFSRQFELEAIEHVMHRNFQDWVVNTH